MRISARHRPLPELQAGQPAGDPLVPRGQRLPRARGGPHVDPGDEPQQGRQLQV